MPQPTVPAASPTPESDGVAIRADGALVRIRSARPDDRDALRRLDANSSDRSLFLRFFSLNREAADRYTDRVAQTPQSATRASLVALIDERVVGLACLDVLEERPSCAEVALLVADNVQHEGIGTLLVEELVSAAHRRHVHTLVADVLPENSAMLHLFRRLGLEVHTTRDYDVEHVQIDLDDTTPYAAAVTERERHAELESLRALRAPKSIAVVGVGQRERSVGRVVVGNLVAAGYTGDLFVVSLHGHDVQGARTLPSVADLPDAPDLVVVAVPAASVPAVVDDCGRRGARVILLLSSGFGETGVDGTVGQQQVLASARRYGMRLVGPNCLGVVNTDPAVRLNATFAPMPMLSGGLGLVSQSGAVGIAVLTAAARRGLGVAEFVSMGNKADVSGNDLLLAWQGDDRVKVIALYLESVGNPRRFARIARAVSRTKPVLALKAGRTATGQRAGQSHTAAAAAAEPVVDALFAQSGVQRVDTLEQLLDAVRVIDHQPPPRGPRVAVVGNSGGPGILAADAAEAAGLTVVALGDEVRAQFRTAVPTLASDQNPVDLGAAVQPDGVRTAVAALLVAADVDSVVTVFTETLAAPPEQVRAAVAAAARDADRTVVAVEVGAVPCSLPIDDARQLPIFTFPEQAVAALACATRAAVARNAPVEPAFRPDGVDTDRARRLVTARLATVGAGWLRPDEAGALLQAVGARVIEGALATTPDEAVRMAERLGLPVALKLSGEVHKSDVGGVRLNLRSPDDVRAAAGDLLAVRPGQPLLLQPMRGGIELIVGAIQDPRFGPVVMVGAGGILTDLLDARSLRIAPLSPSDLAAMLTEPHLSRLLDGFRAAPPVSRAALADLIARIGALVDALPEIAEIDLNPVICAGDDLVVVDAKIRVASATPPPDPLSRMLSMPAGTT